jgi:hypothetical protein
MVPGWTFFADGLTYFFMGVLRFRVDDMVTCHAREMAGPRRPQVHALQVAARLASAPIPDDDL